MSELDSNIQREQRRINADTLRRLGEATLRADAAWHPDDEEVRTLVSRWSWRPNYVKPLKVSAAILGGLLFLGSLFWILYLLNGGLL